MTGSRVSLFVGLWLVGALIAGTSAVAMPTRSVTDAEVDEGQLVAECATVEIVRDGTTMDIVVEGHAFYPGASRVELTCHLWQGDRHNDFGGIGIGPAAVAAGTAGGYVIGGLSVCAEVTVETSSGGFRIPCH